MRYDDELPAQCEILESRRLMSTSVFLGLDCLPAAATPSSTPTHNGGHDDDDDDDQGGNDDHHQETDGGDDQSNPTPTPDPIEVIIPQVTGGWSGSQVKADHSLGAELSLTITTPAAGELNGKLDFTGPRRIRWTGQVMYNPQTGRLTMYYLSGTLVARLDAALVTDDAKTSSLQGTIEYFTPDGSYSAAITLLRTA